MVGPMILACGAFFSRQHIIANWAKVVFVIASLVGLAWGVLGFIVWPPVHVTRHTHSFLLSLKSMCAGIVIGLVASVLIARPYQKRVPASEGDSKHAELTNR